MAFHLSRTTFYDRGLDLSPSTGFDSCDICLDPLQFAHPTAADDAAESDGLSRMSVSSIESDQSYISEHDSNKAPSAIDAEDSALESASTDANASEYLPSNPSAIANLAADSHIAVKTKACNHTFGYSCLRKWLNEHSTCPMCRAMLYRQPGCPDFRNRFDRLSDMASQIENGVRDWNHLLQLDESLEDLIQELGRRRQRILERHGIPNRDTQNRGGEGAGPSADNARDLDFTNVHNAINSLVRNARARRQRGGSNVDNRNNAAAEQEYASDQDEDGLDTPETPADRGMAIWPRLSDDSEDDGPSIPSRIALVRARRAARRLRRRAGGSEGTGL